MMRVAMVAPVTHAFPPEGYGPWERVAFDLTEELVRLGHDVTVFAPEGSITTARLVGTLPSPVMRSELDPRLAEEEHLAAAFETITQGRFDVVHSHLHVHALTFSRLVQTPVVTTLHGVAWNHATHRLLRRYADQPFVSISNAERAYLPQLRYVATVPNGIRMSDFEPGSGRGGYLAFVGRIAPEKGVDLAIEIAERAGRELKIAGPIEPQYRSYFETEIASRLDPGRIDYLGALGRSEVVRLTGAAHGLLMPLRWDEPFGLVVVESLAVGTPVIAWERGAMPEILRDGTTGYLVADVDQAVAAVDALERISRDDCRRDAVERFSSQVMADGYAAVYEELTVTPLPPATHRPARLRT